MCLAPWVGLAALVLGAVPPARDLSEAAAGFHGPGREVPDPPLPARVEIGLIGPARTAAGVELRRGAALAVDAANRDGGYRGAPFALVVHDDDGPWGAATREIVALARDDAIRALVGGLDGQHAHLAELVTAKLWIPYVTPWAFDRTVDYANVPWVFRCPVDDRRQAEALLRYADQRGLRPLLVREKDREGRIGAERLDDAARAIGRAFLPSLVFSATDLPGAVRGVLAQAAPAVLVWGEGATLLALVSSLRAGGYTGPILGPASLATPDGAAVRDLTVASAVDLARPTPELTAFTQRYAARYGGDPPAVAVLSHDAVALTIDAIRRAGLNRARIRDALAATNLRLASGRVRFDRLGGNPAEPTLLQSAAGRWLPAR